MAKLIPMAPDSAGFKVLIKLYHLGGKASVAALTDVLWGEFRTPEKFDQVAAQPLRERGLVKSMSRQKAAWLQITKEGTLMVRQHLASQPAQRQAVKASKPLNVQKFMSWGQTRPGALDYRKMPSVMGGERVPYKADKEETPA